MHEDLASNMCRSLRCRSFLLYLSRWPIRICCRNILAIRGERRWIP